MVDDTHIVLTGGGTGGHVFPGLALLPSLSSLLKERGLSDTTSLEKFLWIGSKEGPEKGFVEDFGLQFFGVKSGKLRRYFSFKNFTDISNIALGYMQARRILKKHNAKLVISIGGFASVTAVFAAASLRIPIISISCDMTLGLAAKLSLPFSNLMLVSYEETANAYKRQSLYKKLYALRRKSREKTLKKLLKMSNDDEMRTLQAKIDKVALLEDNISSWIKAVGNPIRDAVYKGEPNKINERYGIDKNDIVILFLGGSKGAKQINDIAESCVAKLPQNVFIIHQTGVSRDSLDSNTSVNKAKGDKKYLAIDFIRDDYADMLARADIVLARAGAGTIWEIVANEIPSILIPLSKGSSRGDQIENAEYFAKKGLLINLGDSPSQEDVQKALFALCEDTETRKLLSEKCREFDAKSAVSKIVRYIDIFI